VGTSGVDSGIADSTSKSAATAANRICVLYIGGTGRTGSTLLTRLLGQYPQFFAAGELAFLWRFGFLNSGKCGCGEPIRDCQVWSKVFQEAYGGSGNVDAAEMVRLRQRFNSKHMPLMLTQKLRSSLLDRSGQFPSTVERLYQGISHATGCRVIVDSSKEPHYSYILRSLPTLDVHFLHLVRDPRAVAYSWKENRKREEGLSADVMMESRGALVSSAYYNISNIAAEVMWARCDNRYQILRYEDFLEKPAQTIRSIGSFVGEDIDPGLVLRDGELTLRESHTAWGNPNRFDRGHVKLRSDERWRLQMPKYRRLAVTALTFPLVKHYHYSLHNVDKQADSTRGQT
jgi:hypothetical protein